MPRDSLLIQDPEIHITRILMVMEANAYAKLLAKCGATGSCLVDVLGGVPKPQLSLCLD